MNCSKCDATIPDGADFCPKCGVSTKNGRLNAEQLAFYAEQEAKCRKNLKRCKICKITTSIVFVVVMAIYGFIFLVNLYSRRAGGEGIVLPKEHPLIVGFLVILFCVAFTITFSIAEASEVRLEKLQRERLFGEK